MHLISWIRSGGSKTSITYKFIATVCSYTKYVFFLMSTCKWNDFFKSEAPPPLPRQFEDWSVCSGWEQCKMGRLQCRAISLQENLQLANVQRPNSQRFLGSLKIGQFLANLRVSLSLFFSPLIEHLIWKKRRAHLLIDFGRYLKFVYNVSRLKKRTVALDMYFAV
jgi:hypothetical protein